MQAPETPPAPRPRLSARARRRLWVYGGLAAVAWGFWVWQPLQLDVIPKKVPNPNAPVDPDSKRLFAIGTKIVLVTAHPDDSEFYLGGLLTQLHRSRAEIHHIVCTDGDKAYYFWADTSSLRATRRAEQRQASAAWGAKEVIFLGFRDGRLRADEPVVSALERELRRIQPEYIIAFDPDYPPRISHQDHRRSGEATEAAVRRAGVGRWLLRFSTHAPNYMVNITDDWDAQVALLRIHKSQFNGKRLELVTNMVMSNAGDDGERIGAVLGEGLRCERLP